MKDILSLLYAKNENIIKLIGLYDNIKSILKWDDKLINLIEYLEEAKLMNELETIQILLKEKITLEFEDGYIFTLTELKRELGKIVDGVVYDEGTDINSIKIVLDDSIIKLIRLYDLCEEVEDYFEKLDMKLFSGTPFNDTFNDIGQTLKVLSNDIDVLRLKYTKVYGHLNAAIELITISI